VKVKVNKGILNGSGFRFAIIVSSWNDTITSKLAL
jgi:6,7-dimethyl-8-ribityllumazine synthase